MHALVAFSVIAVPAGIALDHGGRFAWGWWILSVLALGLVAGSLLGKSSWHSASPIRWAPPALLLLFAGFAALQTVPLPASTVSLLAPGSAAAFEQWLPAATGEPPPTENPLSVSPGLSRDFAARVVIVAAFAFVAVVVFGNPQFAVALLGGLAVTAALHASLGIYQRLTVPGETLGGIHLGQPFGFFVNRNNAAGLLNVGLAGAVGVVAWRLCRSACPTSTLELSERRLGTSRPTYDRLLIFAVVCGVLATAGIIASGSRGALVGSAAGFAGCLLVAVPAGRFLGFGLAAVLVFVAATYSLTSLGLESQAVDRLSATMDEAVLHDGRLDHWPDAVRAARAYLPLGAGMGSYRYAHLPYQQSTHGSWFANADNQWLEWWVEGGLVALLLIIAAVAVVGISIRRLLASSEPIDRGMAAAGAYGLCAILVSQLFDFALLISPIAIATALLLSAVVSRAAIVNASAAAAPIIPPPAARPQKQSADKQQPAPTSNEARLAAASRPAESASPLARLRERDRVRVSERDSGASSGPLARLRERVRVRVSQESGRGTRPPTAGEWVQTTLGLGLLLCLLWAQPVMSAAAHSQSVVFASQAARGSSILSLQSLTAAEAQLSERLEVQPADYAALLERVAVRVQLFRLHEAGKAIGTSPETYQAAYDHSRLRERRKQFYDALSNSPLARLRERDGVRESQEETSRSDSNSPLARLRERGPEAIERLRTRFGYDRSDGPVAYLHAAAADARAALRANPLSPEPRIWLSRLDFVTGETQLTATRLEQVARLRSGSLVTLDRVVDEAVLSRNWEVARDAWKQSIHLATGRTAAVLARVRGETPLRPSDVIPDERAAVLAAAEYELKQPDPDPTLLAAAQQHLTPALSAQERTLKQKIEVAGSR